MEKSVEMEMENILMMIFFMEMMLMEIEMKMENILEMIFLIEMMVVILMEKEKPMKMEMEM